LVEEPRVSSEKTVSAGAVTDEGITEVMSVMDGVTEEVIPIDGGSDEKTSEMNCTDLERMSIGGVLEKMLAGGNVRTEVEKVGEETGTTLGLD
jgi:hypothetical protein